MKNKENLLNVLIVAMVLFLVVYILIVYIKTPIKEHIKYPIKISSLIGDDVVEWEEYVIDKKPTKLIVYVRHMSSSEDPQVIEDKDKINEVLDAIINMKATSRADNFKTNTTSITYYFEDETGKSMSFTFQEGLLKISSGRYYIDDIDSLYNIEGINLYLNK